MSRQVFHLLMGIAIAFFVYIQMLSPLSMFVIIVLGILISLLCTKKRVPIVSWFLDKFERKNQHPGKGAIFFFLGSLIAMALFPRDIASASILILAVGDSVSPIVGIHGCVKHPLNSKKFLEGTTAGFVSSFIVAMMVVNPIEALFGSFIGMTIEALDLKAGVRKIDDNLTIPMTAGLAMIIIRLLL